MLESPMTSIKNKDKPFDVLEAGDVNDMILLATMTPNCFNLSLQSNYKVVGSLVERSHV